MSDIFKFSLNQIVKCVKSDEQGEVIGRAEYTNAPHAYLVRYCNASGEQHESWFSADAITSDGISAETSTEES
jgi:hypothetical protein